MSPINKNKVKADYVIIHKIFGWKKRLQRNLIFMFNSFVQLLFFSICLLQTDRTIEDRLRDKRRSPHGTN